MMGRPKAKYEKDIIKCIKDNNIFQICDIFAFYPGLKSAQFYNLKLEKSEDIKKALDDNKVLIKASLKNKWYKSDNATLQLALFKLLSTDEELQKLAMQYIDHRSKGERIIINLEKGNAGNNKG